MLRLLKPVQYIQKTAFRCLPSLKLSFSTSSKSDIIKNQSSSTSKKDSSTSVTDHLHHLIEARGPISVCDYMRIALMHPKYGFYQKNNVIGKEEAHFITAPEISPVFGELLGIWSYVQWTKLGSPKNVQLIELGPGKGTLMSDLLRAARHWPKFYSAIQLHMVEQSTEMRKKQQYSLNCVYSSGSKPRNDSKEDKTHMKIAGANSIEVYWHNTLDEVPEKYPTILIANEFLDALPIYKFQLSDKGWREVQIANKEENDYNNNNNNNSSDINTNTKDNNKIEFKEVLNPNLSPIVVAMLGGKLEGKNEEDSSKALDEWLTKRKALLNDMAKQLDNTLNTIKVNSKDKKPIINPEKKLLFTDVENSMKTPQKLILPNGINQDTLNSGTQQEIDRILEEDNEWLKSTERDETNKKSNEYIDLLPQNNTKENDNNDKEKNNSKENNNNNKETNNNNTNNNASSNPMGLSLLDAKLGDMIEVCPEANMIVQNFGFRINRVGGIGLFIDYGYNYASTNSLRGIYKHQFVNYLQTPGDIDITADVDFSTMRKTIENTEYNKKQNKIECFGPIPQGYFLCGLGIEARVNQVLETVESDEDAEKVMKAAERLVLKEQMGELFKCFSISTIGLPLGFEGGEQFL
ncbi:hypothetical protein WA158_002957 [Blastocystis sp. Blastoise]